MFKLNNKGFAISGILYSILILFLLLLVSVLGILGSRKVVLDKTKMDVFNALNSPKEIIDSYNVTFNLSCTDAASNTTVIPYGGSAINNQAEIQVNLSSSSGSLVEPVLGEVTCDNEAVASVLKTGTNNYTITVSNITKATTCTGETDQCQL